MTGHMCATFTAYRSQQGLLAPNRKPHGLFAQGDIRMTPLIARRTLLAAAALAGPALLAQRQAGAQTAGDVGVRLAELEKKTGGRLGVSVLDRETSISFDHREDERFPLLSTFKALAAACVLSRVDQNEDALERLISFPESALVTYSPVTEKHAGGKGMTLGAICEAAVTLSDNTAGNLMLEQIGGPEGLTGWLRSIGDGVTRLDRIEPDLNEAKKGDPRDTTTPRQMRETLGILLGGEETALSIASQEILLGWLVANKTGDERLRAGLPKDVTVGEKTGTASKGAACDAGIVWPRGRRPVFVSVYIAEATVPVKELNPIFAEVGRVISDLL